MLPIVATLLTQGLSILGNAVLAKGQDAIEKKLGVSLDTTPPAELAKLQFEHEEFLLNAAIREKELEIEAETAAQGNVSERWKADMLSDSWLSKNIRPIVLLYLLATYTLFSLFSIPGWNVTQSYVELLAQMLMLVMGAYFVGRTIEKMKDMHERGKSE